MLQRGTGRTNRDKLGRLSLAQARSRGILHLQVHCDRTPPSSRSVASVSERAPRRRRPRTAGAIDCHYVRQRPVDATVRALPVGSGRVRHGGATQPSPLGTQQGALPYGPEALDCRVRKAM